MGGLIAPLFVKLGMSATMAAGVGQLIGSVLLNVASAMLSRKKEKDEFREVPEVDSLAPYRHCYGESLETGTWVPLLTNDAGAMFGAIIFNSRPSASFVSMVIDKRPVELSGDILDFETGAAASNAPFAGYARFWLGLGDQSAPPDALMAEFGDPDGLDASKIWPTDGWRGRTVLWVRLDRGPAKTRSERWPTHPGPPEIKLLCRWSRVWDPRDEEQSATDAQTWQWSENQALCFMDALRQNPMARRPLSQIWLESITHAAEVADEESPVKGGGTEPRYRVGGRIVYGGAQELFDVIEPLASAGGGSVVQVGGRVGYVAGKWSEPILTVTDVLDDAPLEFKSTQSLRSMPTAIKSVFPDPGANWEMQELAPTPVRPGFDGSSDGVVTLKFPLVPYPRQVMRLQKIAAERRKRMRSLKCTLPPSAFELVGGANVTFVLPDEDDERAGTYQTVLTHPAAWLDENASGCAFRLPAEFVEIDAGVYAYDPETDEQDWEAVVIAPIDLSLPAPSALTGALIQAQIVFSFQTPGRMVYGPNDYWVVNSRITGFEWEFRLNDDAWQTGGMISPATAAASDGRAMGTIAAVQPRNDYFVRVRSTAEGVASAWSTTLFVAVGDVAAVTGMLFEQEAPAMVWVIDHMFGFHPSVTVLRAGDPPTLVLPRTVHPSVNRTTLSFAVATAGEARLF